jgi:hypothetical protein
MSLTNTRVLTPDGDSQPLSNQANVGRPDNPFDPARLRLGQNFGANLKKLITTVPVRKPSREAFVRTHPNSDFWLPTRVIELKDDEREI